jgi:hypothetical protein
MNLLCVNLQGEEYSDETEYLKQLSTGVYMTISGKLQKYSKAEEEAMTILRYEALIVFCSLWCKDEEGDYPLFLHWANKWFANSGAEKPKVLKYRQGEFTALLRQVTADEFVAICDFYADSQPREYIESLYKITDDKLQATSDETKEALKKG